MEEILFNKNFKLTGLPYNPENVNFDIVKLHKKYILIKGELRYVEYYKEYNDTTKEYNDIVVKINNVYNRDALGIIISRDTIIDFYFEDDSIGHQKYWPKYYSPDQAIDEGITRRKNMIASAKTVLLRELKTVFGEPTNQQYGFDLLLSLSTQMKYFEEGYTQPLRDAVNNSTKPYMLQNIKDAVVIELTF